MRATILGLLAETPVHPGMGRSTGVIDLPVSREAATDYPVIFGSGVKGAMRDKACQEWREGEDSGKHPEISRYFGEQEAAGSVIVSDARLLLLPVRSLNGRYRWATCPYLLERYARDRRLGGLSGADLSVPVPAREKALAADEGRIFLEERLFETAGRVPQPVLEALAALVPHAEVKGRLAAQVMVLCDDDFAWFARYGLQINARNALDENKRTRKGALWYEETLPPDSLFYCVVAGRSEGIAGDFASRLFGKRPYIQMGGNETVGQGWFAVQALA